MRLKKLNNKITLPPINSRYSQASERLVEVPPLNFHNLSRQERINLITEIEAEMHEAAKNLDFERAMELRDALFELKSE